MIAGRYRVERRLGRGGLGTVYLCQDTITNELVAVKTANFHDTASQFLADETVTLNTLVNTAPDIMSCLAIGNDFLVFEYVAGQTLTNLIADQPRALAGGGYS